MFLFSPSACLKEGMGLKRKDELFNDYIEVLREKKIDFVESVADEQVGYFVQVYFYVKFQSAKKGTMKRRGKRGKREEKSERARGKGKKKGKKGGKKGGKGKKKRKKWKKYR